MADLPLPDGSASPVATVQPSDRPTPQGSYDSALARFIECHLAAEVPRLLPGLTFLDMAGGGSPLTPTREVWADSQGIYHASAEIVRPGYWSHISVDAQPRPASLTAAQWEQSITSDDVVDLPDPAPGIRAGVVDMGDGAFSIIIYHADARANGYIANGGLITQEQMVALLLPILEEMSN